MNFSLVINTSREAEILYMSIWLLELFIVQISL